MCLLVTDFQIVKELLMQLMHQFYKVLDNAFIHCDCTMNQHKDVIELVELSGIEPLASCVQGRRSPS